MVSAGGVWRGCLPGWEECLPRGGGVCLGVYPSMQWAEQNDWRTGVKNITLSQTSFAGGKKSICSEHPRRCKQDPLYNIKILSIILYKIVIGNGTSQNVICWIGSTPIFEALQYLCLNSLIIKDKNFVDIFALFMHTELHCATVRFHDILVSNHPVNMFIFREVRQSSAVAVTHRTNRRQATDADHGRTKGRSLHLHWRHAGKIQRCVYHNVVRYLRYLVVMIKIGVPVAHKVEYLFVLFVLAVSLLHEEWCWKEKTAEIEVVDKDVTDISFVQSGYILSCSLSHDIRLVGTVLACPTTSDLQFYPPVVQPVSRHQTGRYSSTLLWCSLSHNIRLVGTVVPSCPAACLTTSDW